MKFKFLSVLVITSVFIASCGNEKQKAVKKEIKTEHSEKKDEHKKHWAYTGESNPEHWAQLKGDEACGGNLQSPINIIASDAVLLDSGLKKENIHYTEQTVIDNIVNNGHSIQYNFKENTNYVNFNQRRYDLVQFHFHAPAEHTINGVRYPLVMHMVHASKEKDYVVFAILFEEGKENKSFEFLESYLPIKPGQEKLIGENYDFSKDLPLIKFNHFYYKGSLTTPPCTEAVNWFIFTEPETISEAQIKRLSDLMPVNNFRPIQPVNERKIYHKILAK